MGESMLSVRLLVVATKFDIEDHARDIFTIARAIKRYCKPVMHCKRSIAFVIETEETSAELMNRLMPVLKNDRLLNAWCMIPGPDIVGLDGSMDALTFRVSEAWIRVRQRNSAKNMGKTKRRKRWVEEPIEDLKSSAVVQVPVERIRMRKPPRNPDRP